jgi:hypothetical protein
VIEVQLPLPQNRRFYEKIDNIVGVSICDRRPTSSPLLPQNRRFYGKIESLPFLPTYIAEKGRTLGKSMNG